MYEAFYGFKEKPFSMLPDPGFLFLSKKHQTALSLLEYGLLNHVGFCVISGEPGAGKTTILRALLKCVDDDFTVGLITNTHQSFGGLLDWILSAFDLHQPGLTHVEMHQVFMEYLIKEYANNRTVLLIVDEAQNIAPDVLEELRMLSNVNSEKDQLMQVVLAGQPALKETLRKPELMQFAQRIAVDYHLEALNLEETCGYIQHRLLTAGAQKDVFTPAACERIHSYSGGTPRLINLLCETALVYGFADQLELIDIDLIDEMVLERMKNSVVPIVNRDIAKKDNKKANKKLERDFPWIRPEGGTEGLKPRTDTRSNEKQKITRGTVKPKVTSRDATDSKKKSDVKSVDGKKSLLDGAGKGNNGNPVKKKNKNKATASSSVMASKSAKTSVEVEKSVSSPKENIEGDNKVGTQLFKFGLISGIFALIVILVAVAVLINNESDAKLEVVNDKVLELQKQRELEEVRLKQLQIEAEALKKERDAAFAKIEEEKRAKQQAEKLAAEQAALAIKAAEEKSKLEEQKRIAEAKDRARRAKQAEEKAKADAELAKREAARLEEERRLKEQEEARRLELEWLKMQLQEIRAIESSVEQQVVLEETAAEQEKEAVDCSGPAARFKADCR